MRLYGDCIPCQVTVRFRDVMQVVEDEERRLELAGLVVRKVSELLEAGINDPPHLATELHRFVKRLLRVDDIYRKAKARECSAALSIYPGLQGFVESLGVDKQRVEAAIRIAVAGNALDLGVSGYSPPPPERIAEEALRKAVHGGLGEAAELLLKARRVAVIMDNCGEAVLDRVLGDVLRSLGKEVVAVVKGGAFQNDITIAEARRAGLYDSFDHVVSTGSDAASVFLDEVSNEVLSILRSADVIVAKGMANFEYLTEVEKRLAKPLIYLLVAKCRPIAKELGVPQGSYTVRVYSPDSRFL